MMQVTVTVFNKDTGRMKENAQVASITFNPNDENQATIVEADIPLGVGFMIFHTTVNGSTKFWIEQDDGNGMWRATVQA